MRRHSAPNPIADDPRPLLRRLLHGWIGAGLLLLTCVPAARGHSQLIGWLPYWCLLAPLLSLALLERRRLLRRIGERLRLRRPGRRGRQGAQARRRRPGRHPLRLALAALLGGDGRSGV